MNPLSGLPNHTRIILLFLLAFFIIAVPLTSYNLGKNQAKTTASSSTPLPSDHSTNKSCTDDSQCSEGYKCQTIMGEGTVCSVGTVNLKTGIVETPQASCQPTMKITKGECRLTEGKICQVDNDCYVGLICHKNSCTPPLNGQSCSGTDDMSCPKDYKCVQMCPPPVARQGDKPPGYFCELEEQANKPRQCPL